MYYLMVLIKLLGKYQLSPIATGTMSIFVSIFSQAVLISQFLFLLQLINRNHKIINKIVFFFKVQLGWKYERGML